MTIIYDDLQKNYIYKWRQNNMERYLNYCRNKAKDYYQINLSKIKTNQRARYLFKKECKIFLAILRE